MVGVIFTYLRWIAGARRDAADPQALAGWCLIHKKSYRTGSSSGILKVAKRLIAVTFGNKSSGKVRRFAPDPNGIAVWDNRDVAQIRYDHIAFNRGDLPSVFIARNEMKPAGAVVPLIWLVYFLLYPFLAVWALFAKYPANVALLYDEWNEAIGLMQTVRRLKIRYLYFYCPYEIDANALYLLLEKNKVRVNKIPSPNLLSIANQEMLSDVLTLSSPCQADELAPLQKTIAVKEIAQWLPEQFAAYADVYQGNRKTAEAGTLGFYSHGSWIRQQQGIRGIDLGDIEAELKLVEIFGRFLKRHAHLKCTVFLHPKEKKPEFIEQARRYYDNLFGQGRYGFADTTQPGGRMFDTVDVGVGALSTILFERLFVGCKTIFFPAGIGVFPVPGSAIAHVCVTTESELEILILQAVDENTESFLRTHDLVKYTIRNWKPGYNYAEQN